MNYTPIDPEKFRKDGGTINNILILMAIVTASVLVVLLFVLIQKKSETNNKNTVIIPTVVLSPSPEPTIEIVPTESLEATPSSQIATPESKLSPTINE